MKTERHANLPASIRARLQAFASAHKVDFQLVLIRYASERLLYRLTTSPYGEGFILKGAMLFLLWDADSSRTTRDIDLMGFGDSGLDHLQRVFRDICSQSVTDDGLRFIPESVRAETIREEQEYGGVRIHLFSLLERARIPLQVDIGFGNPPFPEARTVVWPGLLDFPEIAIESVSARGIDRGEAGSDGSLRYRQQPDEGLLRYLVDGFPFLLPIHRTGSVYRRHF